MDARPNAPRSISGVFEDALRIYRGIGRDTWLLAFALEFAAAVPSIAWQLHLMSALLRAAWKTPGGCSTP